MVWFGFYSVNFKILVVPSNYSNILIQLSHNEFGQPAGITPLEGVLSLEKYNSR